MDPHVSLPHPLCQTLGRPRWLPALAALLLLPVAGRAQTPFPVPRLATLSPAGVRAGDAVAITVTGSDLDDATALYASHPGIKAERLPDPPPPKGKKGKQKPLPPAPLRFKVTVAPDTPRGMHDVRVVGKWGISNPRVFVVGDRAELVEQEPNSDVPQAQRIDLGAAVHGAINPKVDVDYYVFAGKKGQRVVVHCAAASIDSTLTPQLQLFDAADRQLAENRQYRGRDALLDAVLPEDGDYCVRVCEFAYVNGGPQYFYRLSVSTGPWLDAAYPPAVEPGKLARITLYGRNLPGGQPDATAPRDLGVSAPLERLAVQVTPPAVAPEGRLDFRGSLLPRGASLDGFAYRLDGPGGASNPVLLTYADAPLVLDNEANDAPAKAQELTLPCCLCGRIERTRDRDYYAFTAKKGDVYVLEGYADRLRVPMDLVLTVKRADNDQVLGEFADNPDIPTTVGKFYTHTDDPRARFVAPADGRYVLVVRSRTGDFRAGPRYVYRVSIRKERPDFRLVVVGNNDTAAGGCTVRQGGSQDLEIICFRRDGFAGEVLLTAEGLPSGVTCPPQVLGPKAGQTVLVVTAAANAPDWAGEIRVKGTARIGKEKVVREARAGCLVWPTPQQNVPAISRLARSLCLAVRAKGPYSLTVPVKELAVPVGGAVELKLGVTRHWPDFKVPVQLDRAAAPTLTNGKPIPVPRVTAAANQSGATVKFNVPSNTEPGVCNLVFRGTAKFPFARNPKEKKTNVDVVQVTPPVRLTVYNSVTELSVVPAAVTVSAGGQETVVVRVKRLHGYKGAFKVELVPPKGTTPVSAAAVTIPAGADEAKLTLKAPPKVKSATSRVFAVKVTAAINKVNLAQEAKFTVTVSDAQAATIPGAGTKTAGPVRAVVLLADGADGWRYAPASQAKGDGWRGVDFNDGGWKTGRTPLGHGEPEIASRKGTEIALKGQPVVFRRTFDMPAEVLANRGATFRLAVASDDSAIVYLNGALADQDPESDHEYRYWNREVEIPAARLRPGRNVVAVLLHNGSGSSDLYLDLKLTAHLPEGKAAGK